MLQPGAKPVRRGADWVLKTASGALPLSAGEAEAAGWVLSRPDVAEPELRAAHPGRGRARPARPAARSGAAGSRMKLAAGAALRILLVPGTAVAQPRPFSCVGAEQLENDVFAIPFAPRATEVDDAARAALEAAAELAKREPERNLCVLGHASPQEGGATTGAQLAARRAGAVAEALARLGVERDRVRAEAHRAAFARGGPVPAERSVTVVVLPPQP